MEKTQHTPGPWTIRTERRTRLVCDEHGNQISAIRPVKRYGVAGDDAANARLIAAAPTMYEALKALVESLDWESKRSGTTYAGHEDARAAIAKAEGR